VVLARMNLEFLTLHALEVGIAVLSVRLELEVEVAELLLRVDVQYQVLLE